MRNRPGKIQQLKDEIAQREVEASVAHEREAAEHERLLRVYGFADFGIMRTIAPKDAMVASEFTTPLTFYLGRLNLYYDARPDPDFRFLVETRLTLYPNGTSAGVSSTGQVIRTSTAVGDISSPNASASVTWGSIILSAPSSTGPAIRCSRCAPVSSSRPSVSTTSTMARRP